MKKYAFRALLCLLLVMSLTSRIAIDTTSAKTKAYSFNLFDNLISNEDFNDMKDAEKIKFLTKQVKRQAKIVKDMKNYFKHSDKVEKITQLSDVFGHFALKEIKENLKDRIAKIIEQKENTDIEYLREEIENLEKGENEITQFASFEENTNVDAKISQFVYDSNNITNANIFYKITHDEPTVFVLKKALEFDNNLPLLASRWKDFEDEKDKEDISYAKIIGNPDKYKPDEDVLEYLKCINLSELICEDKKGKDILLNNISGFVAQVIDRAKTQKVTEEFEKVKDKFPNKTQKLWVTSYNFPDCHQTKGGVKSSDGNCYATEKYPCAIGSNKGKTKGLCGNPDIGAKGHNLRDMIENGERPIAVTQDLKHLIDKKVYLRCYNKDGSINYDDRCNGEFIVRDFKNKRYTDSVDLPFLDKKDNIGNIDVEIYYE